MQKLELNWPVLASAIGARVAQARQVSVAYAEMLATRLNSLDERQRRITVSGLVALLHLIAITMLFIMLHIRPLFPAEVTVSVGGPYAEHPTPPHPPPLPNLVVPEQPSDLAPPVIEIANAPDEPSSVGSPNVTKPAEAIAEAHTFPALPANLRGSAHSPTRLRLSVSEDGVVTDAEVITSSGSSALDILAVEWVKAHWRYRPAMRNGEFVAVTTTAIVLFLAA